MGIFNKQAFSQCEYEYKAFIERGGNAIISGKTKYIGGHQAIKGEKNGTLVVNNNGVFFKDNKGSQFFLLPVDRILKAQFETGEQVSRNAVFSRLLAASGFVFAYKQKTREMHMFLTISYIEGGVENVVLLETQAANEFASTIAKIRQEANEKRKRQSEPQKSIAELMIEINELRALGIITVEEFLEKKKELLSRI